MENHLVLNSVFSMRRLYIILYRIHYLIVSDDKYITFLFFVVSLRMNWKKELSDENMRITNKTSKDLIKKK